MTRLLVKMPNWVGDCLMATPALALMKKTIPNLDIHALVRPSVAGILEDNPHISSVIVENDRDLSPPALARLRDAHFDAIALMTNSLRSAWLARKLAIPIRIGFNREHRGLLLTHKIPYHPLEWQSPTQKPLSRRSIKGDQTGRSPRHMVEYYLEIARATANAFTGGDATIPPMDYQMVLPLHRSTEEKVARLLRDYSIQGKILIGINPGAAHGPAKRWPVSYLGHMLDILERPDWAFISTASPGEVALNDALQAATSAPIARLGEHVNLRELPALISRMSVLVTNDSGPMHIAAARGVPTVAIFGPTDPPSTHPWGADYKLMQDRPDCSPCFLEECPIDHRCMRRISGYDAAEAVLEFLSQNSKWTPTEL